MVQPKFFFYHNLSWGVYQLSSFICTRIYAVIWKPQYLRSYAGAWIHATEDYHLHFYILHVLVIHITITINHNTHFTRNYTFTVSPYGIKVDITLNEFRDEIPWV